MSSSKYKVKGLGKSWAKIYNEENIYERDPNEIFVICSVCEEVKMMRNFDSWHFFDHKGGQFHNQKKHNAISEKARIYKAAKAGTKLPSTKQSSMLSIVSRTNRRKYDSTANSESLHKEDK